MKIVIFILEKPLRMHKTTKPKFYYWSPVMPTANIIQITHLFYSIENIISIIKYGEGHRPETFLVRADTPKVYYH